MAATHEVALDLNTLVERLKVNIVSKTHPDGKLYELRTHDELGVIEHQRFQSAAADVRKLQSVSIEKMDAKQAKSLKHALDTCTQIVLPDIEPDVLKACSDGQLTQVIELFISQFPDDARPDAEGEEEAADPSPTGDG